MKHICTFIFLFLITSATYSQDWTLVWSDEFDYTGLPNSEKWSYDVGGGGWGNNELQYYTDSRTQNANVANGKLTIKLIKEVYGGKDYTSARLVTKNKGDWTYGRFEISAKLPSGKGTWPAIWMLPTSTSYGTTYWPDNGEIDIMEHVGYDQGNVHATTHCKLYYGGSGRGAGIKINDCSTAFHVYAAEWNAEQMDFYVDATKYFTCYNNGAGWQSWPWDKNFHLLLNIAFGGNWGGAQGIDNTILPQTMEVEYVRVYQKLTNSVAELNDMINSVTIYPNPISDTFQIKVNSSLTDCKTLRLKIFSTDGKELIMKEYSNLSQITEINFDSFKLSQGTYIVNLVTDKGVVNKKLIIK